MIKLEVSHGEATVHAKGRNIDLMDDALTAIRAMHDIFRDDESTQQEFRNFLRMAFMTGDIFTIEAEITPM